MHNFNLGRVYLHNYIQYGKKFACTHIYIYLGIVGVNNAISNCTGRNILVSHMYGLFLTPPPPPRVE